MGALKSQFTLSSNHFAMKCDWEFSTLFSIYHCLKLGHFVVHDCVNATLDFHGFSETKFGTFCQFGFFLETQCEFLKR